MSIAGEIQRLQGVKSDILEAIAEKGVTVPAGSALADCPELIGRIGSGGGGGGGNENPDGSIKYGALSNIGDSNVFEIGNLSLKNCDRFVFKYRSYANRGVFSIVQSVANKIMLALSNRTYYVDMRTGGSGTWGGSLTPDIAVSYGIMTIDMQYNAYNSGSNTSSFSQTIDGVTTSAVWGPSSAWGYGELGADTLWIFKGRDDPQYYKSGIMDFYEFNVYDFTTTNLKYNFTPAEKNGVAGLYESVNNVFYPEPYNDGTIFLTK